MRQLSNDEFESTFTPPMTDITSTAEEVVEVWEYIEGVMYTEYACVETDSWDVEYIYTNQSESHQHILINTGMENVYLIVVVDVHSKSIYGHHLLNLNQKYGLSH